MPLAAAIQLSSTSDIAENVRKAEILIRRAARYGATLIATPEATTYLGPHDRKVAIAEPLDGPTHRYFGALAAELQITLLIGSVVERCDAQRTYNTSLLFGPEGDLLAHYRKIHLFDVDLSAMGGVVFRESDRTAPGDRGVLAETDAGVMGLSICFDLRFPDLYQSLVEAGATILSVPSAFTMMTGKDHWHALLRARAIECQSFVIAPAQCGRHDDQGLRHSYGHSVIIDPWGTILAECGDGEGLCLAEIDPARVDAVRQQIPLGRC